MPTSDGLRPDLGEPPTTRLPQAASIADRDTTAVADQPAPGPLEGAAGGESPTAAVMDEQYEAALPSSGQPEAALRDEAGVAGPRLDWLAEAQTRSRELGLHRATETPVKVSRGNSPALWVMSIVSLLVAIASLAYNVVLTQQLLGKRDAALSVVDKSMSALNDVSAKGLDFNFPVSQTIDWEGDIPFKQDMQFPIKTTIHFATTVQVPVNLGALGTMSVSVPVDTDVPVDMSVPVHIDQSFHIKLKVPINMNVPVHVAPDQQPIKGMLDQVRSLIEQVRQIMQ
jgi:hypothetical protein